MTFPNSTPTKENNRTGAPTVVERHREVYERQARPVRPGLWPRLRPWLIGAAAGLILGGAAAFALSYQVMPPTATHVQNVFVTINGRPAVILSGDVVFDSGPLSLSPTPAVGQP